MQQELLAASVLRWRQLANLFERLGIEIASVAQRNTELLAKLCIELNEHLGVLVEKLLQRITSLNALLTEREPRARLLHESVFDREVENISDLRDAFVVQDVELDLLEWR